MLTESTRRVYHSTVWISLAKKQFRQQRLPVLNACLKGARTYSGKGLKVLFHSRLSWLLSPSSKVNMTAATSTTGMHFRFRLSRVQVGRDEEMQPRLRNQLYTGGRVVPKFIPEFLRKLCLSTLDFGAGVWHIFPERRNACQSSDHLGSSSASMCPAILWSLIWQLGILCWRLFTAAAETDLRADVILLVEVSLQGAPILRQ